jgi:hypothetical protein
MPQKETTINVQGLKVALSKGVQNKVSRRFNPWQYYHFGGWIIALLNKEFPMG